MIRDAAAVGLFTLAAISAAEAQSLRGSHAAMVRQNSVANDQDLTFLETASDVRRFVETGRLVPVRGNVNYKVADVSFPYARPAVKLFIERLAAQYNSACNEKLVVTSLTRPESRQPANAHELSVHPTGMAVDVRVSKKASCRRWLESTLKALEGQRVLDATRETRPAHYHIAVFPNSYNRYVADLTGTTAAKVAASTRSSGIKIARLDGGPAYASVLPVTGMANGGPNGDVYTVKPGDSLWTIARRFGTTVEAIREANNLKRSIIKPGQKLAIPGSGQASTEPPE